ncbi:MAG: hypothetical protein R6X27_04320 [Candidatus Desulfacyla sp.]
MAVTGKGDAIGQVVRRFNLPAADVTPAAQMLKIDVKYDTSEVAVNDLVKLSVSLAFSPLPELDIAEAVMIVVDVSVPTGYQTWLPFKSLKCTDKRMINIGAGELDFKEVSKAERIDAIPTEQKPQ